MTLTQGTKRIVHIVPAFAFAGDMACMLHLSMLSARYESHTSFSEYGHHPLSILSLDSLSSVYSHTCSHDHTFMRAINLGSSYSVNQKSSPPLIGSLDAVDSESRDE